MDIQEFFEENEGCDLADISWEQFPEELQAVCRQFITRWFEETSLGVLRELSGFDDMSLDDLLRHIRSM